MTNVTLITAVRTANILTEVMRDKIGFKGAKIANSNNELAIKLLFSRLVSSNVVSNYDIPKEFNGVSIKIELV